MNALGPLRFLTIIVVSIIIHVAFGWMWTIFAGILAGMWVQKKGWLTACAGVGAGWAVLVLYNFIRAPVPTYKMTVVVGGIFGNLPAPFIVVFTVFIGCLVGFLGGLIGRQLTATVQKKR